AASSTMPAYKFEARLVVWRKPESSGRHCSVFKNRIAVYRRADRHKPRSSESITRSSASHSRKRHEDSESGLGGWVAVSGITGHSKCPACFAARPSRFADKAIRKGPEASSAGEIMSCSPPAGALLKAAGSMIPQQKYPFTFGAKVMKKGN